MPNAGEIIRPGDVATLGTPTWANFTPTWTTSGGGQSLGNGTLTGRYCQTGKLVFFQIKLTFGSTTVRGAGRYGFGGLPVARATSPQVASAYVEDNGGLRYGGAAQIDGGGVFSINLGSVEVSATTPVTWGTSDLMVVEGFYEAA